MHMIQGRKRGRQVKSSYLIPNILVRKRFLFFPIDS